MAGRIRTIKPELLEDSRTAKLSHGAWRLFVSGLLLADDFGTLRAEPGLLAGAVFWGSNGVKVAALTEELVDAGLWQVYTVNGQRYVHVPGWSKHQKVQHPNENRRLPGPPETLTKVPENLTKVPETLTPDHDHDHDQRPRPSLSDRVLRVWLKQDELRKASIPGAKPLKLSSAARRRVEKILRDYSEEECIQALEQSAREAKTSPEGRKYFDGVSNWRPDNFDRKLAACGSRKPERREIPRFDPNKGRA